MNEIVKNNEPFTVGETLIKPCLVKVVTELFGDKDVKKVQDLPLSNDTITRRVKVMAIDSKEQLISFGKQSPIYTIQIDESTDVTDHAILLVYVRFIDHMSNQIQENLLACLEAKTDTTASSRFK